MLAVIAVIAVIAVYSVINLVIQSVAPQGSLDGVPRT